MKKEQTLIHKPLPQNPDIWVSVPDYKEPILPVNHGGFGWYGLQAYDFEGDKLMCHECGGFYDSLGQHLKIHGITPDKYRETYSLLASTKLTSKKCADKFKSIRVNLLEHNPQYLATVNQNLKRGQEQYGNTHGANKKRLQYMNMNDNCHAQLLRRLNELARVNGGDVSEAKAGSSLLQLLISRFGSFNKAKQFSGLITHKKDIAIEKYLVLDDMVNFFRKYGRWPYKSDYEKRLMICSYTPVKRLGHIRKVRQEAMKLKDEQDKRAQIDVKGIASRIEMENAGSARR